MKKIITLCVYFFITYALQADNGAVAFAYPMDHVEIDGDLSDWTGGFNKYSINKNRPNAILPTSRDDFHASFMVGFNLENHSIYLGIEVIDDSHIVDRSSHPRWGHQDKHLLYIDPKHAIEGSCPISYAASQIKREIGGSEFSWDPQATEARWDNIELQIKRQGNTTVYEYRISFEELQLNTIIGLDHVFYDKDADDEQDERSYIMWGDHAGKSGTPHRCGDLILLSRDEQLLLIQGSVLFESQALLEGECVQIISQDFRQFRTSVTLDSAGRFQALLPKGAYSLDFSKPWLIDGDKETRIDLEQTLPFSLSEDGTTLSALQLNRLSKPGFDNTEGLLHQFELADTLALDAFLHDMMAYYAIPGASLGIIKQDELLFSKAYGVKNILTKEAVDASTIFQAASITKPVFAYTVLRLVDKGLIDLDKPLYHYLAFEELEGDERYKKMTARHVLSHQSGLPNWGRKVIFEPGTSHGYSGEGFEYLKRVVEKITNKDILQILDEEVLEPTGMTNNTYFVREEDMYAKVALGHAYAEPRNNWIINQVGMARSMYTEAAEFSQFILHSLHGQGLSQSTFEEMINSQTEVPFNQDNPVAEWDRSFGLGFLIKASPWGKVYGHGGSNAFFQSLFEYYPEKQFGFVLFTNNNLGYHLGNDLREFLIIGK